MREACFCGWTGEIADRVPVCEGDCIVGLACPQCGHLDYLEWLPAADARRLLEEVARRQHDRTSGSGIPQAIG